MPDLIHDDVRAGWCEFTRPIEGCFSHPYLDNRGIVTVGFGCALFTLAGMRTLDWFFHDGTPCLADDVAEAWNRLHAMPPARVASFYAYEGHIQLQDDAIVSLAMSRLQANAETLSAKWRSFPEFHPAAQAALLSIAYAVGSGAQKPGLTSDEWPGLQESVYLNQWVEAADRGVLRAAGNPGVLPRNLANRALFRIAGGVDPSEARDGWPRGTPTERDAADRAVKALDAFPFATL